MQHKIKRPYPVQFSYLLLHPELTNLHKWKTMKEEDMVKGVEREEERKTEKQRQWGS